METFLFVTNKCVVSYGEHRSRRTDVMGRRKDGTFILYRGLSRDTSTHHVDRQRPFLMGEMYHWTSRKL